MILFTPALPNHFFRTALLFIVLFTLTLQVRAQLTFSSDGPGQRFELKILQDLKQHFESISVRGKVDVTVLGAPFLTGTKRIQILDSHRKILLQFDFLDNPNDRNDGQYPEQIVNILSDYPGIGAGALVAIGNDLDSSARKFLISVYQAAMVVGFIDEVNLTSIGTSEQDILVQNRLLDADGKPQIRVFNIPGSPDKVVEQLGSLDRKVSILQGFTLNILPKLRQFILMSDKVSSIFVDRHGNKFCTTSRKSGTSVKVEKTYGWNQWLLHFKNGVQPSNLADYSAHTNYVQRLIKEISWSATLILNGKKWSQEIPGIAESNSNCIEIIKTAVTTHR